MPFTSEQFFDIFEAYNLALSGTQWVFWVLTAAAIGLAILPVPGAGRIITLILAAMWLWTGVVYHIYFFSTINTAALVFGAVFIVQAAIFVLVSGRLEYKVTSSIQSIAGIVFLIYALILYPMLGEYLGHAYPRRPTFGTPCPTTIFTFGILLFLTARPAVYVYLIPLLWSLVGTSAAYLFGVYEDLGLLVAGTVGSLLLFVKK